MGTTYPSRAYECSPFYSGVRVARVVVFSVVLCRQFCVFISFSYLCNRCLSPLTLWVRTPLMRGVLGTTLCDKFCQWLVTGQWFSPGTPVSFANKTDLHNIAEIVLTVVLNTIILTLSHSDFELLLQILNDMGKTMILWRAYGFDCHKEIWMINWVRKCCSLWGAANVFDVSTIENIDSS